MALSVVQRTPVAITTTGTASTTLTFPSPPTVGNAIIVPVSFSGAGSPAPGGLVTDNRGNTYELIHTQANGVSGVEVCVYACLALVGTGSPFTLTLTASFLGTSVAMNVRAIEVGGFTGGSLAVDRRVSSVGTSTAPSTGTTAVLRTTAADAFAVAVVSTLNPPTTITVGVVTPAWTEEFEDLSGASRAFGEGDSRILPTPSGTTQSAAWTLGASMQWAACLVVFASADLTPLAEGRVTQDTVELLSRPVLPAARVTQDTVEILSTTVSMAAEGRITQDVIEVLGQVAPFVSFPIELRATTAHVGTTDPVDTTGCSLLVIGVPFLTGTTPTVSDSKGNTYVPLTAWGSPGNARVRLFYCLNGTVGPGHTFSVSPYLPVLAFAFTNVASYQTEVGTGYGSTPSPPKTTGSVTPTSAGALVLTGLASPGNGLTTDAVTPPGFALTQGATDLVPAWSYLGSTGDDALPRPNFPPGSVVVVDGSTYTLKTALDAAVGTVLIGTSFHNSLEHLVTVISTGGDGVVGTTGTPANPLAYAQIVNTNLLQARARTPGVAGNSIGVSTTAAEAHWFFEGVIEYPHLWGGSDALTGSIGWTVQSPAAPINPSWSWTHAPTDVALTTAVFLPVIGVWVTPGRVTQALVEILQTSPPAIGARVTQLAVDVFFPRTVATRQTQAAVEVMFPVRVTARQTQGATEVFWGRAAHARDTQLVVEVLLVLPPCTAGAFPVDDLPAGGSCPVGPGS